MFTHTALAVMVNQFVLRRMTFSAQVTDALKVGNTENKQIEYYRGSNSSTLLHLTHRSDDHLSFSAQVTDALKVSNTGNK